MMFEKFIDKNVESFRKNKEIKKKKRKQKFSYSTDSTDKLLSLTVVAIISSPLRS